MTSSSHRWIKLVKTLQDSAGKPSVGGTSLVSNGGFYTPTSGASDFTAFHAAGMHTSRGGPAAALIAGNGFDNSYCIYGWAPYTPQVNWYNGNILSKSASAVQLTYVQARQPRLFCALELK
jgi:hypothetical protein